MGRHTRHAAAITAALAVVGAAAWLGLSSGGEPAAQVGSGGTVAAAAKDRVTQPLRDEHKELIPHIEGLSAAGDAVGVASLAEQQEKVHASYVFLTEGLIPHAVAEDKVLYAKVDELVGTNGKTRATDTMRRDHQEVGTLTDELGKLGGKLEKGNLTAPDQHELRRVLYSLNGIVGLHFAKEEEVYLPLLDRTLTATQAQEMFEEMEEVTAKEAGGEGHAH